MLDFVPISVFSAKCISFLSFCFFLYAEYEMVCPRISISRVSKNSWSLTVNCISLSGIFCKFSKLYTGRLYCSFTSSIFLFIRVGKKYRYAGIPRYVFGVVRTAAHLPVPRYSGVSIYSN